MDFNHKLPEHERLEKCPYNSAHLVVSHRMAKHLLKCRKSSDTSGTKECRFNVTHIFPSSEISHHELNCPDRILVETFKNYRAQNKQESGRKEFGNLPSTRQPGDWD